MAEQLTLVLQNEVAAIYTLTVDVSSLSLLSWLVKEGWSPAVASDGANSIDEAIALHIPGTSDDNLATQLQSLDDKIREVGQCKEFDYFQSVWLRTQKAHETNARQAMILSARRSPTIGLHSPFAVATSPTVADYQLGLTRTPAWEATAHKTITGSSVNLLGGTVAYSGVAGDVPARIARLKVDSSGSEHEIWAGVKSSRLGVTPANFDSWWDLHNAINYYSDTTGGTTNVDATAKSGYTVITTFATVATMANRIVINISEGAEANRSDQVGRYQVLLRAKNSDGSTFSRVRMKTGSGGIYVVRPRVRIDSSSWKLYPLGEVDLPVFPYPPNYNILANDLYIDAERTAGSGTLIMDGLVMIPSLDGYLHLKSTIDWGAGNLFLEAFQRPDEKIVAHAADSSLGYSMFPLNPEASRWGLEPGSGVVVFAAQDLSAGSSIVTTATITLNVFERWLTLRGSQ